LSDLHPARILTLIIIMNDYYSTLGKQLPSPKTHAGLYQGAVKA